jgi:hypothetical protein
VSDADLAESGLSTWASNPMLSRPADESVWARLWGKLRRRLAGEQSSESLDLAACRVLAQELSQRLEQAMQGPVADRLPQIRAAAKDLDHLIEMLRIVSPTDTKLASLVEAQEALNSLLGEPGPDAVALADRVSRTKAALDAFSGEPSASATSEGGKTFWK